MKHVLYTVWGLSLLTLFSCRQEALLENRYAHSSFSLEKETCQIPMDDSTLSTYQVFSTYLSDSEECIVAYSSLSHSIDFMDVRNSRVSHTKLDTDGEHGIMRQVSGLYAHNLDSIWLFSQGQLYLTDKEGKVKQKVTLPFPEGGFIMIDTNFTRASNNIYYHPLRKSLFYQTVLSQEEQAIYEVYEYELSSGEVRKYPLVGGEIEKRSGYHFGWKQFPNVTYTLSGIVFNFPITSNVYSIDLATGKTNAYGGQSKYTSNVVSELSMPYSFEEANKHLLSNVHFFDVKYDPRRNVYYRLHLGSVDYNSALPFLDQYNQKTLYLTVFNSDFEIMAEEKLDNNKYSYLNYWGVLKKGLFIAHGTAWNEAIENDNKFIFDVVGIKPIPL